MTSPIRLLVPALALAAAPAAAELPQPVRAMIDAAIATEDAQKVETVVEIARQTHPADSAEIDALHETFLARQREIAAAEAAREEAEIRSSGLLERWGGRGEVGGFVATGNSDNVGATVALALQRTGIDWQHRLRATADYQRSNGETSREQYFASYEPRIQVSKSLFAFALAQYESDRFQGYTSRYSLSGGLGYKVLDGEAAQLSLKAGPAWRRTDFVDGASDDSLGALAGLDFDWKLAERLKLTQDADLVADAGGSTTVIVDSDTTSVLLNTGLEATISDGLTTRLSYTVDYDSNPPAGAVSTDTLTRFTLVYGF
jgi:putative salt-induced outer membrane protein